MGLFDFFFGSPNETNIERVPDQIWLTKDGKFKGIARAAAQRMESDSVAVLLVAHFPDALSQLEDSVREEKLIGQVPCTTVLANNLNPQFAASLSLEPSQVIDIIVAERHPLPSADDRLEEFADHFTCRCRFSHHQSLEDPVMEIFAGKWVRKVLATLGMDDEESIESDLVTRRVRRAQEDIENRKLSNNRAASSAEWLEENCPDLWKDHFDRQ